MRQGTVLHLFGWDKKFVLPFRDLIHEHFADGRHQFIIYGDVVVNDLPASPDTRVMPSILENVVSMTWAMTKADKIIIHGLFSNHLLYLLAMQPGLLQKCYWVMWGGDLYTHDAPVKDWRSQKNSFLRHFIVRRIGHFITYIKGDFEIAQQWYGAKGAYHHCLMYPSNLYREFVMRQKQGQTINILVGNSADPTNRHAEVFAKLTAYSHEDIQVLCPLSYGPVDNAERITRLGKDLFGDRFVPLPDFMPFTNYLELLGQIDIAVFAHKRQQGMGSTITLLGLGKTVFMRTDVTPWKSFAELGVTIFDVDQLNISRLSPDEAQRNRQIISEAFSEAALLSQLAEVFR